MLGKSNFFFDQSLKCQSTFYELSQNLAMNWTQISWFGTALEPDVFESKLMQGWPNKMSDREDNNTE